MPKVKNDVGIATNGKYNHTSLLQAMAVHYALQGNNGYLDAILRYITTQRSQTSQGTYIKLPNSVNGLTIFLIFLPNMPD